MSDVAGWETKYEIRAVAHFANKDMEVRLYTGCGTVWGALLDEGYACRLWLCRCYETSSTTLNGFHLVCEAVLGRFTNGWSIFQLKPHVYFLTEFMGSRGSMFEVTVKVTKVTRRLEMGKASSEYGWWERLRLRKKERLLHWLVSWRTQIVMHFHVVMSLKPRIVLHIVCFRQLKDAQTNTIG